MTVACLGAAWWAGSFARPDVRRALVAFFLSSAGWAGTYIGFLLVDTAFGKHLFYQGSLIVGFGTVFAWLWFCSAYSGRRLHQMRQVQVFAGTIFALVTALKVTNPWHDMYYGLEPTGSAFGLVVTHGVLYWVVMALSYALAGAGYLMTFEVFLKAGARTGPLVALTSLTALPAALNVTGHLNPWLLDITHEPLGVAVFAVGVLFAYKMQFSVVQVAGSAENPNLTVGSEGRVRGLGGGIEKIVPLSGEEDLGRPLTEVLPGLAQTLRAGEPTWKTEFGGDTRYYQVMQADMLGMGETQTVILSDITERKRKARRLKEAKKEAELSKLEAEEASRMKSAMLANMSHEVRTPLTGIIGFAEAIGDQLGADGTETSRNAKSGEEFQIDQVAHFAGLIEDSGRRLLNTLDAVLNLSKLEAGQMTLGGERVNLAGQARQVAKELKAEAEEKGLELSVDAKDTWTSADEGGLKIVVQNLLSNAIKYTEEGGVEVRTYREEGQAILEVEDTGIGMDPSRVEELFEPFRQASEGMSREYEGTGLGLAVTKEATEEMGGSIEVDTQKGEGSRFTVRLPLSDGREDGSGGGKSGKGGRLGGE